MAGRLGSRGIDVEITADGLLAALTLGFLLGLRHATDADHVVAVSTIVSEERNAWRGIWIGVSWGLGHTTPLLLLGIVILLLKETVLQQYEAVVPVMEFGVGVMLAFLGIQVFWRLRRQRLHIHEHGAAPTPHFHIHAHEPETESIRGPQDPHASRGPGRPFFRMKSYLVGIVHGLAGSAAVILLLLPQVASFGMGIAFLLLFGLGTMIAMGGVTLMLGIPFAITARFEYVNLWVARVAGAGSLLLGLALMSDVAAGTHFLEFLP